MIEFFKIIEFAKYASSKQVELMHAYICTYTSYLSLVLRT